MYLNLIFLINTFGVLQKIIVKKKGKVLISYEKSNILKQVLPGFQNPISIFFEPAFFTCSMFAHFFVLMFNDVLSVLYLKEAMNNYNL